MNGDRSPAYHVLLEGKSMGPYDRRTIVGMRIKKTLTSDDVLIDSNGARLTVGDVLGRRVSQNGFNASRSGVYSLVQGTYAGSLVSRSGKGFEVPAFDGELEVRVQSEVVRIAGRFRKGLGWKDDRIKIPLKSFVHARTVGSRVDVWVRGPGPKSGAPLQRLSFELFSPDSAGEFVEWLSGATPPPPDLAVVPVGGLPQTYLVWIAVIGVVAVLVLVGLALAFRRAF
ncbi:MAG: hypothetical protein KIS62_11490 [Ramlibacter sp.]|nr:hypothetical protein [Ramlibacter sp.]MBX3659063.1 hypothetical protein [Ramlibacter sp.]MCW5650363.1 hypothetical protein [Ramlibacter sp.]